MGGNEVDRERRHGGKRKIEMIVSEEKRKRKREKEEEGEK